LVTEISLYYDAWSEEHQITFRSVLGKCPRQVETYPDGNVMAQRKVTLRTNIPSLLKS